MQVKDGFALVFSGKLAIGERNRTYVCVCERGIEHRDCTFACIHSSRVVSMSMANYQLHHRPLVDPLKVLFLSFSSSVLPYAVCIAVLPWCSDSHNITNTIICVVAKMHFVCITVLFQPFTKTTAHNFLHTSNPNLMLDFYWERSTGYEICVQIDFDDFFLDWVNGLKN